MFYNIFITLSQWILNDKLLLLVIDRQNSNFSSKFKLEPITIYHLGFVVKMFENIMDVALLLVENVNVCCTYPWISIIIMKSWNYIFSYMCFLGIAC